MNLNTRGLCKHLTFFSWALATLLLVVACPTPMQGAGSEPGLTDRVGTAAQEAKQKVEEVGQATMNKMDQLWQTIEAKRIKNRTRDEIVAWIIMGILVGGLAGTLSAYGSSGLGRLINFIFGLIGAFIGGILASLTQLDLGLGPVLIRYEELLLSFVGAVFIVLISRWLRRRSSKDAAAK